MSRPLRAHQVKHGTIARPLGAADLYLFALMLVLGFAMALVVQALNDVGKAREAFRSELWQAGLMLEDADALIFEMQQAAKTRAAAAADEPTDT